MEKETKNPENEIKKRDLPQTELGIYGLKHSLGYVHEEFLPELRGRKGRKKYKEMVSNDATIGGLVTVTQSILRKIKWDLVAGSEDKDEQVKLFMQDVLDNMETSISFHMSQAASVVTYGFSTFEKVYSLRPDGMIGLHRLSFRPQDTIYEWIFNEKDEAIGFIQESPVNYKKYTIPLSKCVNYRLDPEKNSPEGKSLLRNAYKSYVYMSNIQMTEAIAIERELAGLPVVRVPGEILTGENNVSIRQEYESIARDLKLGSQGGVVLPSEPYQDDDGKYSNMRKVEIDLISAKGSRLIDTDKVVKRYQADIGRSLLADFLLLGNNDRGSFAMSDSKIDMFKETMESFIDIVAETTTKEVLQDICFLNGYSVKQCPILRPKEISKEDLDKLSRYVTALANIGIQLTDDETQINLRRRGKLPEVVSEIQEEDPMLTDGGE